MSLDLYLISAMPIKRKVGSGVYIRENGQTKELSLDEARKRYPDMIFPNAEKEEETTHIIFKANITHNLNDMASACGLYDLMWHSEGKQAKDVIFGLRNGLNVLVRDKGEMMKYNPENGWGTYENLVQVATDFLSACEKYPNAKIDCSR